MREHRAGRQEGNLDSEFFIIHTFTSQCYGLNILDFTTN